MKTLRARLMFGYAFGSALLLAVSGWSILHLIENVEVQEFDDNLLQYARRLSIIAEQELGVVTFEWEQLDPDSTMQPDPEDSTGHLFRIAGRTLGTVATNIDAFPDARPLPLHWDTDPIFHNYVLSDGTRARVVSFGFPVRLDDDEPKGTVPKRLAITVARRNTEINQLLSHVYTILILVGVPVTLLGAIGMYTLLGYSLRGLTPLQRQLETLAEGDLSQNMDCGSLPDEFLPLINSINDLTNGLNERIGREKRFVAAASHELRTPIATIQTNLEIARQTSPIGPVIRSLEVSQYMGQVVERLLTLNRLDYCSYEPESISFNIEDYLREAALPYTQALASRGVTLDWDFKNATLTEFNTDPVLLSFITSNIFSNIAAYATVNSVAEVIVCDDQDGLLLSFINHTDPTNLIAPDRLGEPFWRGDVTRNLSDKHVGLGLAIAKAAAAMLDATLIVKANQLDVFCATIRIKYK